MTHKEIADKYIGRRGEQPSADQMKRPGLGPHASDGSVRLSMDEYRRLLMATECDDMIVRCDGCGAWIDRDEPAYCPVDDVSGCWEYATGSGPCVRHRAIT